MQLRFFCLHLKSGSPRRCELLTLYWWRAQGGEEDLLRHQGSLLFTPYLKGNATAQREDPQTVRGGERASTLTQHAASAGVLLGVGSHQLFPRASGAGSHTQQEQLPLEGAATT